MILVAGPYRSGANRDPAPYDFSSGSRRPLTKHTLKNAAAGFGTATTPKRILSSSQASSNKGRPKATPSAYSSRLSHIPNGACSAFPRLIEMGIYAVGRLEFANEFTGEEESVRKHLIEAKVALAYEPAQEPLAPGRPLPPPARKRYGGPPRDAEQAQRRTQETARHRREQLHHCRHRRIAVIEETNDEFELGRFGFFTPTELVGLGVPLRPAKSEPGKDGLRRRAA